jgi:hypothetical protein
MEIVNQVLIFLAGYPIHLAWQANRRTALNFTIWWSLAAWGALVCALMVAPRLGAADPTPFRYLALSLIGCACVAILGARRPGALAWNFVVAAFLAVALMPLAEQIVGGGKLHLEWLYLVMVGGVLTVGIMNYLPTRLAPAALMVAVGCALELLALGAPRVNQETLDRVTPWSRLLLALAPWAALWRLRQSSLARTEADRLWLDFRDRFGLVWGQRLREQFNRSASHAGWPVVLSWQGLRRRGHAASLPSVEQQAIQETMRALMKRFGLEGRSDSTSVG